MNQQFCAAVQALSSSATTPEQRKAAEAWLLEFQRSEEGWPVALELVASTQPQEVQTFAAQALKRRAWVSRSGDRDLLQRLQNDLLNLMAQSQQIRVQPLRQVVLALVGTIMPLLQGFNQLLQQLAQAVPTHITLLVLETLAEEVACLEPFGPGSSEDRLQAVADIKAGLRSSAAGPLSWLAHVASQHAGGSPTDSATQAVHKQLLCCFQAWVRLGTLHDMSPSDSHSLVSLALKHLEDLNSQAFPAAGEVLAEIMEHCPQEWLPALHDPCMRAAQQAKQAAEEGRTAAAEILCKVVAAYAVLAINIFEPASSPQSSACLEVLMGLAQLPHVAQAHGETGDPVAWPALATWTQLAEFLMDVRVGGYEVFDDEEFFGAAPHDGSHAAQQDANGHDPTLTQGNGTQQPDNHTGNGGSAFTTGTDLVKAQEATSVHTTDEVKAIFERLLCGLLNNLVVWQQKTPAGKSCYVDNFTPTFTATLNDCLGCCCSVIGPQRFTSLLWMLMDRPDTDAAAPLAAAAAMHAVSAAGSLRLTSEPGPLQTLAGCMAKAAAQQQTSTTSASFLVPFCCAAAATSRTCIKAMAQGGGDAKAFINNAFQKALNGLGHADDSLDLHTPAAFTIKQIVTGASEAGLPAPRQMVQALAGVLPKVADTDAAAEQALVVALCMALGILEGGQEAQHNALYETYQSLTGPLHQSLGATQQALQGGRSWADIRASVEEQVVGPLRRYSLLLQHLAPQQQEEGASTSVTAPAGQKGSQHAEGFNWLAQTFIQQLCPLLSGVLRANESVSGEFVQPMCRCMTVIIKAQAAGVQDVLQQWLEVLASVMFRPKGRHASEPFCAALAVYGGQERFAPLAQQAVSAVLGASRASECKELRSADKDPELAEALLKVASAYMRHVFKAVAAGSAEQAEASIAAVAGLCAACSCANARGVALAALQTVGSVLAAAREPGQAAPHILVAVGKHAALLTTGLMGSLLSLSPLGRVVKVQSLLVDLGGISQALAAQSNGQTHQQQPPHEAHLRSWLAAAAAQFQLPQAETESVLSTWPGAVSEALAAERMGAREQQAAGRRIKKLLRDFAELHSRTQ